MSRVRITSDGTPFGTAVYLDGRLVDCVVAVSWRVEAGTDTATCTLELDRVDVDLTVTDDAAVRVREAP